MRMSTKSLLALLAISSLLSLCSSYTIEENGVACIFLNVTGVVEIRYEDTVGDFRTVNISVNNELPKVEGLCSDMIGNSEGGLSAQIKLTMVDSSEINVTFVQRQREAAGQSQNYTALERVIFTYDTRNNPDFVNPKFPGLHSHNVSGNVPLHQAGHFYFCDAPLPFGIAPDVLWTTYSLKLQAIDIVNNAWALVGDGCNETEPTTSPLPTTTTNITTTHESTNTTTPFTSIEPTNTTEPTNVTTIHTTLEPSTSTAAPVTDIYFVEDTEGNVCLLLQFNATFSIPYTKKGGQNTSVQVNFNPKGVDFSGSCDSSKQFIELLWRPKGVPLLIPAWVLKLVFDKTTSASNEGSYAMDSINLFYTEDLLTFPDTANLGTHHNRTTTSSDLANRFKTPVGQKFRCNADEKVDLGFGGLEMDTNNFQVEAFRTSPNMNFSKDETVCTEDSDGGKSSIVPIIIGVVLALLVIVVLVAYFIGRRRSRNNNYQQLP